MTSCRSALSTTLLVTLIIGVVCFFAPASSSAEQPRVQVLVTSWCGYCRALEQFLKEREIPYDRYDIEHSSEGMKLHDRLGGGGVPIIKIGGTIIRGFNPPAILLALKQYSGRAERIT